MDNNISILLELYNSFGLETLELKALDTSQLPSCPVETPSSDDSELTSEPCSQPPFIFPPPPIIHPFPSGDSSWSTPYSESPTLLHLGEPIYEPGVVHPMGSGYHPMPKGKTEGQSIIWLFRKHSNPNQSFIRTHSRADTNRKALPPAYTL